MATFVARGFLRFDAVVPNDLNEQFLAESGRPPEPAPGAKLRQTYGALLAQNAVPEVAPGTPLAEAYLPGSALHRLLGLPIVAGAIESLLGDDPVFDHHFLHMTFPPRFHEAASSRNVSQHTHQDSTIDPRQAFDLQIMYYPHTVTRRMGGTRFIPGTHLRKVSEVALGRYQNIRGQQHMVCEAGTLLFLHHGIWHGGGVNTSDETRTMFKIRMHASGSQVGRWDMSDLTNDRTQRPIFFVKSPSRPDTVAAILTTPEPWFEQDTGRLEYVNRIKLWRYVSGDPAYDADYWMTRLENEAVN
jgi:hypothetical protein